MDPLLADVFNNDAFSVTELSQAVDLIPLSWGRLGELNCFPDKPVGTTTIAIEFRNNQLYMLPTVPRGGPATVGGTGRRTMKNFTIAHIPHEDAVSADEVQNVRAFGLPMMLQTVQNAVAEKFVTMRNKHDITIEHMRAGMLQGKLLDSDGTVLLDTYSEFGVTQPVVFFDWAGGTVDIVHACNQVKRWTQDKLMGDTLNHVHAFCAPDFMDAMLTNAKVLQSYTLFTELNNMRPNPISDDMTSVMGPRIFPFQGIMWEEYRAYASYEASDGSSTSTQFIAAGDCRFFPMGTKFSSSTFWGPPTFLDQVNTKGLKFYARSAPEKFNRRLELYTESNPLPLFTKPLALIRGVKGTGSTTAGLT